METNTLIIGAGPSGFAVAAALNKNDTDYIILDENKEIAHSWKAHYERLHLHSIKQLSRLPFSPFSKNLPRYPSKQQFVDYLENYATIHNINPHLETKVNNIEHDGSHWNINAGEKNYRCNHLIIATGYNRKPVMPSIENLESFNGKVLHSKQYTNGKAFSGKKVLVIGSGNSGVEIAIDLFEHGAIPSLVVRSPTHVVPMDLFGLLPAQVTSILLNKLPLAIGDWLAALTLKLVVGDLSKFGIQRPTIGPLRMITEHGRVSMFDSGIVKLIKQKKVVIVPGVSAIAGNTATFTDHSNATFEAIICATGFKPALSDFITESETQLDKTGCPTKHGLDAGNSLFFVGYQNTLRGFLNDIHDTALKTADIIKLRNAESVNLDAECT